MEKPNSPNPVKKKWSKVAADSDRKTQYVVLITKMPLKIELWKLKTPLGVFGFHNSSQKKSEN